VPKNGPAANFFICILRPHFEVYISYVSVNQFDVRVSLEKQHIFEIQITETSESLQNHALFLS